MVGGQQVSGTDHRPVLGLRPIQTTDHSFGGQNVVMTSLQPADAGVREPTVYPAPQTTKLQRLDTPTACPGAFHYLRPQDGAPPNGGTVHVGQKFAFDLMIN